MLKTVLMCQQERLQFENSPARIQIINELKCRGGVVTLFYDGRINDRKLKKNIDKVVNTSGMLNSEIRNKIREMNPDIVICSTVEDTEICYCLPFIMKNTAFYYYNLEITVFDPYPIKEINLKNIVRRAESRLFYSIKKLKEILFVRGCRSIVIQDKLRKKILKKHGISHPVTWLIPNTYYVDHNEYDVTRKRGLIYSGGIQGPLKSFLEQLENVGDVEITIAGRDCRDCASLKDNSNIKIIRQNLFEEEYTKFISAYDIALIWYSKINDNMYYIGMSSGKLFKHLSIGQPVIVNNVPGLAEEVRKYKLGIVIDDVKELSAAVQTIMANYDFYVKNIKKVYKTRYDYKKLSQKFFDSIMDSASK